MLLRTAIGWHFLYEGVYKVNTSPAHRDSFPGRLVTWILPAPHDVDKEKEPPFSAEGYLRNATGPFAPYFRALVPDVNGLAKLDRDDHGRPDRLKNGWKAEMERIADHFGFDADQRSKAQEALNRTDAQVDDWFFQLDNAQRIKKYYRDLRYVLDIERSPDALPYQKTLAYKNRRDVEKARKELTTEVDVFGLTLRDAWLKLATPEQREASGPYEAPRTSLDWINLTTMWGLTLVGLALMLGLFTPLAALAGAAYLLNFYLSMPPWPGLPVGPQSEGHYLYVNKNLIEMLACLVLASTPNGLWLGLDALLFGRFGKRPAAVETTTPVVVAAAPTPPIVEYGRSGEPPRRGKR